VQGFCGGHARHIVGCIATQPQDVWELRGLGFKTWQQAGGSASAVRGSSCNGLQWPACCTSIMHARKHGARGLHDTGG
jgi:hypothetical protein